MAVEPSEIKSMEDAKKLALMILSSLKTDEMFFNPYRGSLFVHPDGTITFMGKVLRPEQVSDHLARHMWENRKKLNKEIRKWRLVGPHVINCGC
ncbi:MAG: hypothetical protein DRH12_17035 [Deltaproteobacteria bacterium]|nr:MAG: hypothetical protein DRH12_17035 [Deltaproteobacteria bacterium]